MKSIRDAVIDVKQAWFNLTGYCNFKDVSQAYELWKDNKCFLIMVKEKRGKVWYILLHRNTNVDIYRVFSELYPSNQFIQIKENVNDKNFEVIHGYILEESFVKYYL